MARVPLAVPCLPGASSCYGHAWFPMPRHRLTLALTLTCSLACNAGQGETGQLAETDSETGEPPPDLPPEYACAEVVLEGALPITVTGIDTRGRGDDYTPYIGGQVQLEELIFAWVPDEPTRAIVRFDVDDPTLEFYDRRIYQFDTCGDAENFAGKSGTGASKMLEAGQPFMFAVENCEGDCSVTVEVFEP